MAGGSGVFSTWGSIPVCSRCISNRWKREWGGSLSQSASRDARRVNSGTEFSPNPVAGGKGPR